MDGNSSPESRPLKTWEAVVNWKPEDDTFCVANVQLRARTRSSADSPRTLVCHDLAGGYLDDRFVQGVDRDDLYVFYHWQYVDVFVYFSHNFVTIPPPCWINAAHKHGVKVLGTLITEWDEGAKITEKFLNSEDTYTILVEKLVQIAKFYNFDGWLVNIENEVPVTKVRLMRDFLELLHESMHESQPESEVIWYDSILNSGKLDWQNALNERNRQFFDRCDGIFLNYNWTEANLIESKELAEKEHRVLDVYVGVDVFGRGTLGGGGWNTIEAVTAARYHDLSVAIFAPGWVYEKLDKTDFIANNNRFWAILSDMCPSHGPASLPFATSFCPGFGKKYFVRGQEVSCHPWTNMSVQHMQPTFTQQQFHGNKRTQLYQPIMGLHQAASYNGGGCLQLSGCLATEGIPLLFNLYNTNMQVPSSLTVTFSFMRLNGCQCGVFLQLKGSINGEDVHLILDDQPEDKMATPQDELARVRKTHFCRTCNLDDVETIATGCKQSLEADDTLWSTRCFKIGADIVAGMVIDTVSLGMYLDLMSEDRSEVLLGQIRIFPSEYLKEPLPEITNLSYHSQEISAAQDNQDGSQKSLSVTLTWTTNHDRFVSYYYIWENEQFIGQAACNMYRICEYLPQKSKDEGVIITVQPVLSLGFEVPKNRCASTMVPGLL